MGAHPGVAASTLLSNRPIAPPGPAPWLPWTSWPRLVRAALSPGSCCLPLIKVTEKGEKRWERRKTPGVGRPCPALPWQGSRSLHGQGPGVGQGRRLGGRDRALPKRASPRWEPGPERARDSLEVTQQIRAGGSQQGRWPLCPPAWCLLQWQALAPSDPLAPPHPPAWNIRALLISLRVDLPKSTGSQVWPPTAPSCPGKL